jgi:hypothetical protein
LLIIYKYLELRRMEWRITTQVTWCGEWEIDFVCRNIFFGWCSKQVLPSVSFPRRIFLTRATRHEIANVLMHLNNKFHRKGFGKGKADWYTCVKNQYLAQLYR